MINSACVSLKKKIHFVGIEFSETPCSAAQDFINGNATMHERKIVSMVPVGLRPWISGMPH